MTTTAEQRITIAEELLDMPDDGYRYELVRGELIRRSYAGMNEGAISVNVLLSVYSHVKQDGLGMTYPAETGFQIQTAPDHIRAPSVGFIRLERMNMVERKGDCYFPGAPDLAVEVAISSDTYYYMDEKVADWLAAGTRMVVVVNPRNKTVKVHRSPTDVVTLTIADILDGSDVVPGWQMPITDIFAD